MEKVLEEVREDSEIFQCPHLATLRYVVFGSRNRKSFSLTL
jgi:hypothetical protein